MFIESGLIAMAILAADAPPAPRAQAASMPSSSFQLKVITIEGLGWRSTAFPRLVPVARQGTSTVWTADKALAKSLEASSQAETATATASLSGDKSEGTAGQIFFIAHMNRFADGPINQATAVAYTPEVATFEEGIKATVNGRKLDQGVLTTVRLEDHHLEAIHTVGMSETVPTYAIAGAVVKMGEHPVSTIVQVPEVSHASVSGEWMIPNDGVILISLGVHTAADPSGKAVVRERLAILEVLAPSPMPAQTIAPGNLSNFTPVLSRDGTSFSFEPIPEGISRSIPPVPVASLVMQPTPARSLPEAVDAQGKVVELPPLPEDYASADLDRIKPAPNQPSPQAPNAGPLDPEMARTSFIPVEEAAHVPTLKNGYPVDSISYSCFARKLDAAGISKDYDLVITMDAVDTWRGMTIKVNKLPSKCDDKECQAEAAEAEKIIKTSGEFVPPAKDENVKAIAHPPIPVDPRCVVVRDLPTGATVDTLDVSFFPSIDEAARFPIRYGEPAGIGSLDFLLAKVTNSAGIAGFEAEVVPGTKPGELTVTFKKVDACEAATCPADQSKKSVAPHCENGADCEGLTASKLLKMGGPTGAEAVFVKFLESLQKIEPELSPLGELVADRALVKICGALNQMGFPISVVETKEAVCPEEVRTVLDAPAKDRPAGSPRNVVLPKFLKAVIGSGFKIEIKIEPMEDQELAKVVKELPSAKSMNDDVQYLAIPDSPKVDASAKKAADETPKTIKCPPEFAPMPGQEAYRRAMAKLIEATIAAGKSVEMKFDPADNPAFCQYLESLHPGMKPGVSFDFDIVEGPKVDTTPATLGFNVDVKNADGTCVLDAKMNLTSVLQVPGKTETVLIPIAGNLALEVKATIVPIPAKAKP